MIVFSIDRDAFPGITFIGWEAAVFCDGPGCLDRFRGGIS